MSAKDYVINLETLLTRAFIPAGYNITQNVELDSVLENSKYGALSFGLDNKSIVYREGKVTSDRPGAFLSVWQRPTNSNNTKPIPLKSSELDYLLVHVKNQPEPTEQLDSKFSHGIFIFPTSLLIEKGIVYSDISKGKTGFRVFPPWSQDRGTAGTKVFSKSGKKTQHWQLPYFLDIDENGLVDSCKLQKILNHKKM